MQANKVKSQENVASKLHEMVCVLNLKHPIPTTNIKSSKIPSRINSSCSNYLRPISIKHSGMQLDRSRRDKVPWTCAHSMVGNNTGNFQVFTTRGYPR